MFPFPNLLRTFDMRTCVTYLIIVHNYEFATITIIATATLCHC